MYKHDQGQDQVVPNRYIIAVCNQLAQVHHSELQHQTDYLYYFGFYFVFIYLCISTAYVVKIRFKRKFNIKG